jgi:hypothetical protein
MEFVRAVDDFSCLGSLMEFVLAVDDFSCQAQQYILKEIKGMSEGWAQRRDGSSGAITFDSQKQKIMN